MRGKFNTGKTQEYSSEQHVEKVFLCRTAPRKLKTKGKNIFLTRVHTTQNAIHKIRRSHICVVKRVLC